MVLSVKVFVANAGSSSYQSQTSESGGVIGGGIASPSCTPEPTTGLWWELKLVEDKAKTL